MSGGEILGLDVGISTTDLVGSWAPEHPLTLPTGSFAETAEEGVRRLLQEAPPPRGSSIVVAATGVGLHRLPPKLVALPVRHVSEMEAIGRGGLLLSGLREALVVSLGTGTALVSARDGVFRHVVPGTGVGGGTLVTFARALLGVADLDALADLAARGDRFRVDLTIGEVVGGPLGALPPDATASNLGKWSAGTSREDLAAGLVNLVAEVAMQFALLGLQITGQSRAVLVGKLPWFRPIGERLGNLPPGLADLVLIPPRGGLATALGALEAVRVLEVS